MIFLLQLCILPNSNVDADTILCIRIFKTIYMYVWNTALYSLKLDFICLDLIVQSVIRAQWYITYKGIDP